MFEFDVIADVPTRKFVYRVIWGVNYLDGLTRLTYIQCWHSTLADITQTALPELLQCDNIHASIVVVTDPSPTPLTINIELVIPLFYFWIVTELMAGLHYWSRSLIMSPLPTIKNYQELLNYKSLSHYTLSLRDKVRAATRHVLTSTNISNCSNSQLTQTVGKQNG